MDIKHLILCNVMSTRVKCELRIALPDPKPRQAFVPVYEPITLATVSQSAAYNVLAIAATVFGRLEGGGWAPAPSEAPRRQPVPGRVVIGGLASAKQAREPQGLGQLLEGSSTRGAADER